MEEVIKAWTKKETVEVYGLVCDKKSKSPITGFLVKKYTNGELKKEIPFLDGKENGIGRRWYKDGQLRTKESYKYGKAEGPFRQYHRNGQLQYETNFKDAKQDGEFREWDQHGQLIQIASDWYSKEIE